MYQALYRKYRPQTFDDTVGQPGVTQTLKNQLINNRLSHAYLFTGTRGTGKTSCAKILAKAVNCEHPENGNPCNCCPACRSIDAGSCLDVLEIDAASNNGVDNVRSLRDDAIYTPAEVKMRVYIIDEVHMLSMAAFNALLKLIEEPPEHLLFILATTELHKVPATILSRCQRFAFRRILPEDIADRLQYISYKENFDLEPDAAAFLARLADGGLRDAVSLLDQCASAAEGTITTESVCKTLGLAGTRKTAELMTAIGAHDATKALSIFSAQYAEGKDLSAMLDELCTVARDLLILSTAPGSGIGMISGICTEAELRALLPQYSAGELLRMTSVLRDAAAGFNTSANRRIDAELCLLRLCSPETSLDAEALNARLSRLEEKISSGRFTVAAAPAPVEEEDELPPPPDDADAPPAEPQPIPDETPVGFWPELVRRLRSVLPPQYACHISTQDDSPMKGRLQGSTLLMLPQAPSALILNDPKVIPKIAEAASALAGRPVAVKFVNQEPNAAGTGEARQNLLNRAAAHPGIVKIN